MSSAVVRTLPTSTTNITGFFAIVRGSSLRKRIDERLANNLEVQRLCLSAMTFSPLLLKKRSVVKKQMLEDGAKTERWEKRQCADDQNHAREQNCEKRRIHRESAGDGGTLFFCARFPASASIGTIIRKRPQAW